MLNRVKELQQFLSDNGRATNVDGIFGQQTESNLVGYIKSKLKTLNYALPNKAQIVYIRTDYTLTNTFDDFGVLFVYGMLKKVFNCSTTAGRHYVLNPLTVGGITGTAIAVENQIVKDGWRFVSSSNLKTLWLGMPYFQQVKDFRIYRDGDKDNIIGTKIATRGMYGINGHHAGWGSLVDRWSAGCQVTSANEWADVIKSFQNGYLMDFIIIG
jgi:hypothetical protein